MKLFTLTRKGYFGGVFSLKFLNREVLRLHRSYMKESLFLFGKKVFRRNLPQTFIARSTYNNSSVSLGLSNDHKPKRMATSKTAIFVVDLLATRGGVETRLYHQISYLQSIGYEPWIVTQYNLNDNLKSFHNILLDFRAPNFAFCLEHIIKSLKPEIVEFQFNGFKYIYDINISSLKRLATVGAHVHSVKRIAHDTMAEFDYRICSCANHINKFKNTHFIPNFVKSVDPVWDHQNQNQALFISRIAQEKLTTLDNFIKICKLNNIKYKIAGPIDYANAKVAKYVSRLDKDALIGEIDTYEYLAQHANEYLFVGGVGQVVIEAASFGIPALVVTHDKDYTRSSFVTESNFDFLVEWNFVINARPQVDILDNLATFFDDAANGSLEKYSAAEMVSNTLSIEKMMTRYMDVIQNCKG